MSDTLMAQPAAPAEAKKPKTVKCVVWDLDHTVWDGILLEDGDVPLRPGVLDIIRQLDERGILQSVASRNDHDAAMARLRALGIDEYFLYPQINWNAKGQNVAQIAKLLNINLDTFLFVDDQPFEREEVQHACPAVRVLDAATLEGMLDREDLNPEFITDDSRNRRRMYMADIQRNQAEETFSGPSEDFLRALDMRFTLAPCSEADLQRAEELTQRTNQLNTTGYTYDYDELNAFRTSPDHVLLVAGLEDRYGTYGKIGLALIEKTTAGHWTLKLLLMSCRVMSRGVGTIMMSHIMRLTKEAGAILRAEFKPNGRNRMMEVTYRFGGFREVARDGDLIIYEHGLETIQPFPEYVRVEVTR
ncbi:HAD-IIIC family phosphatase [Longimicrobium sp.]|uniref:HAD-IIIC family phosphatase n=1 Tax=Longimicrobium sp. TaxID=2029185 RepID=UPI002E363504|nr:HAD-IIIC family phosphatase [Longimicrobium sp.]HEX6038740.1 HAD-IIIC family phosphatase [Longimicrobium sp.]